MAVVAVVRVGMRVHQFQGVLRLGLRRVHGEMNLLEAAERVSGAWGVGLIRVGRVGVCADVERLGGVEDDGRVVGEVVRVAMPNVDPAIVAARERTDLHPLLSGRAG